jgi:hypothetical protein
MIRVISWIESLLTEKQSTKSHEKTRNSSNGRKYPS